MIQTHEIEALSNGLISLYRKIENDLIRNIASEFSIHGPEVVEEWRLNKLQQLGALTQKNIRTISKLSGRAQSEIEAVFSEAGLTAINRDEQIYQQAFSRGLVDFAPQPADMSPVLRQIMDSAIANTRSTFNMINTTALQSARMGYIDIINQVYLETVLGVTDYTSAMRKAVRQLADNGITGADYISASGRRTRTNIDVAVRRNIITSVSQTAADMQLQRAMEWGCNLVEVSSHIGARPDHAVWQGGVYSINGGTAKYPNLVAVTGYGTVTGLCGANCRHVMFPFFEGFSEQAHKPYGLRENKKVYDVTQKMRGMERDMRALDREIRKENRRMRAADEIGDTDGKAAAQTKIKKKEAQLQELEAKLKQFARDNGQIYQPERTTI